VLTGGALIVPAGLLARLAALSPPSTPDPRLFARETAEVERLAMEAVLAAERALGFDPRDVSAQNRGYDIDSAAPRTGATTSSRPRRGTGSCASSRSKGGPRARTP